MSDVFDDLARAYSAGLRDGRKEAADEIERLREALRGVIRVPDKAALDAARAALEEGKE